MKLSIITINLNNRIGLEKTAGTISLQTYTNIEWIIIDGGSNDGSLDIIKKYMGKITYWVSEPDLGIYNAMNKGIKVAQGEYCLFINSGDTLFDCHVVSNCMNEINIDKDYDYYCGGMMTTKNGHDLTSEFPPEEITAFYLYMRYICHPASFIKTELLKRRPYDERYKLASDWKQSFEELIIHNASFKRISTIIARYDMDGLSSRNPELCYKERDEMIKELLPARVILDYQLSKD